MTAYSANDIRWMRAALNLARRGVGRVSPNPAVGCILIQNDIVVGRGWTQPGGRPHAETHALAQAGNHAKGATAYVTLEPCTHYGKTPPCVEALVKAGISRVVVALQDPDPRVSGGGLAHLKALGIDVTYGVLQDEARHLNLGFITRLTLARPYVTAKIATTLDGKIATSTGESKWITGEKARAHGHLERAKTDAILVGSGTYLADQPALNCRLAGMEDRSPLKVIMQGRRQLGIENNNDANLRIFGPGKGGDLPDPEHVLAALAEQGINQLLIEGGPTLVTAFLNRGLIDRLLHYNSGLILGEDGKTAFGPLSVTEIDTAPRFILAERRRLGEDSLDIYERLPKHKILEHKI